MKTTKKVLSVFLTLLLLVLTLSCVSVCFIVSAYTAFEFGSYPQTNVTAAMGSKLNPLVPVWNNWTSYGYYSGTGEWDDGQMTAACPWCGKTHEGFFQKIIGWFHSIFAKLFGVRFNADGTPVA